MTLLVFLKSIITSPATIRCTKHNQIPSEGSRVKKAMITFQMKSGGVGARERKMRMMEEGNETTLNYCSLVATEATAPTIDIRLTIYIYTV
jgi:hypothetical protein